LVGQQNGFAKAKAFNMHNKKLSLGRDLWPIQACGRRFWQANWAAGLKYQNSPPFGCEKPPNQPKYRFAAAVLPRHMGQVSMPRRS
jgi:hypothetical protein